MESEKYKILIADDEYWTREKIRRMIEWDKYGLIFLEPAVDGEDVLRKMEEHRPDIVITDINMPYLDGVELLRRLQEQYPDVVTFVISGYDDFDYVKNSFLAGSINYLVKPVSRIDLINALTKALELISKRKQQKEEILKAASFLQDREFSQLLERKETPFMPNITINGNIDYAGVTLILLKIHNLKKLTGQFEYDMNRLSFAVKRRIHELMGDEHTIVFNHVYRSNEFIVVSERENQVLRIQFEKIAGELEQMAQSPVSVIFSDHSFSMDSIHQAYIQTVSLLMTRPFAPVSQVISPERESKAQGEIRNHFDEQQKNELLSLLKRGQMEEAKDYIFHKIGLSDCQTGGWQYLEVRQTVKRVAMFLMEYFSDCAQVQSAGSEDLDQILDKELELLDCGTVCELLGDFVDGCTLQTQAESDTIRGTVRQAAEYIREHYFEPLTLRGMAQHYHVEHSYFSRMFRREIGTSLLQYITKIRIEKAKEYIREGNGNLTEIAFLVGYDDYTYFNKVFRKAEGMSPREYRGSLERGSREQ